MSLIKAILKIILLLALKIPTLKIKLIQVKKTMQAMTIRARTRILAILKTKQVLLFLKLHRLNKVMQQIIPLVVLRVVRLRNLF
ncbi:hypothetical protein DKL61_04665 [Gammaproteobacteria bacterium ESL0073]|nr:hypothetical protein DKL61_04665 [Gammaproteobacteria bacterium ESL0073]